MFLNRRRIFVLGLLVLGVVHAKGAEGPISCNTSFQLFAVANGLNTASGLIANSDVLPDPSTGVTVLLPEDDAFGSLTFSQPGRALNYSYVGSVPVDVASGTLSSEKLASVLLFWSLPVALDQKGLQNLGRSATGLSLVTQSRTFDLSFLAKGFKQTAVLGKFQNSSVTGSYRVCNSWVHTTSTLLWPSATPDIAYLPDPVLGGRYIPGSDESGSVPFGGDVFNPETVEAATLVARRAQQQAALIPILSGLLAGLLLILLLAFILTLVSMRARQKRKVQQVTEDLEAQFRREFGQKGGAASTRAKGSADAVLARMLSAYEASPKMPSNSRRNSSSSSRDTWSQLDTAAGPSTEVSFSRSQSDPAQRHPRASTSSSLNAESRHRTTSLEGLHPIQSFESLQTCLGTTWEDTSWQIDASDVTFVKDAAGNNVLISRGGFGAVYQGKMSGTTDVACKPVTHRTTGELALFVQEIQNLKDLRHINIVQFLGVLLHDGKLVLVTEFLPRGSLQEALSSDMAHMLSWGNRGCLLALDIARGMLHLHSRRILHLDLKASNVLLGKDWIAKIADAGLSKMMSKDLTAMGSFEYMAPEVLIGQPCSEKADIWSLGCILWQIVTGEDIRMRQCREIRSPEECPMEIKELIQACRRADPGERPSARDIFDELRESIIDVA